MDRDILTTTEAAKILGVSVRTAQLLIEGGSIPSWKTPGGHRRVYRRDILAAGPGVPVPSVQSARVVLIARPERIADYRDALATVGECVVHGFTDVHAALIAIGALRPAAVVIEAEAAGSDHRAVVESLRADPTLGGLRILIVGSDTPSFGEGGAGRGTQRTRAVEALALLPAAVAAAVGDDAAPPFETAPPFPVPGNEGRRLVALERAGLVDTPPEIAFDRLTWLAAHTLDAPIALFTVLTVDRQWFKSRQGLDMIETPRSWAFCNHTILRRDTLIAEDLATDERFATNPAVVGGPKFRFYAGSPIVDPDGFALGSLCVIDTRPRRLDAGQTQALSHLAALASDEIELRATDRRLRRVLDAPGARGG